ncbi:hypothetical protein [Methanosphaerula palustris]|uniref:hypothetical protein n=1 Tax=Methanosphaerula palustris TaxID=475088 RepID=UPI0013050F7D|nr:hypothetical protein [Methanosphaerula palustris]
MMTRQEHHRYPGRQEMIGFITGCRFAPDHAGRIRRLIRIRRHTLQADGHR